MPPDLPPATTHVMAQSKRKQEEGHGEEQQQASGAAAAGAGAGANNDEHEEAAADDDDDDEKDGTTTMRSVQDLEAETKGHSNDEKTAVGEAAAAAADGENQRPDRHEALPTWRRS